MDRATAMFPLQTVLFPGALLPLHVFEPRYREMIEDCLGGDGRFGVVLIARGSEVGGGETRTSIGTMATIIETELLPDGRSVLLVRGSERFTIRQWLPEHPYPNALIDPLDAALPKDGELDVPLADALGAVRRARALLSEYRHGTDPLGDDPFDADAETRSWWLCDQAPLATFDRQRLLECRGHGERLELLARLSGATADDLERLLASG